MRLQDRLRVLRTARHLTQRETARRANINTTRYCYIENGHEKPTERELKKLARVLKVELVDLTDFSRVPQPVEGLL